MNNDNDVNDLKIEELLEAIQLDSLKLLLTRIRSGEANATEIATAVKIAREYGMTEAWRKAVNGTSDIPGLEADIIASLPTTFDEDEFN